MTEFYTNLPPKDKDILEKTMDKLKVTDTQQEYEFNVGEYDSTIAFFVKRGFTRPAAESTAIAILSQAKIDNVKVFDMTEDDFFRWPVALKFFINYHYFFILRAFY